MSRTNPGRPPAPTVPSVAPGDSGPPKGDDEAVVSLAPDEPSEHLFRRLLAAYLGGARSIRVVEGPQLSDRARKVVLAFCQRTAGSRPGDESRRGFEILVEVPLSPGRLEHRLGQLGREVVRLQRAAVDSWTRMPFEDEEYWQRRDDEVDREAWYLERALAVDGGAPELSYRPKVRMWTVVRSLERIADHALTLGEVGPRLAMPATRGKLAGELRQFHALAVDHLEAVLTVPDSARANDLLDVGEALLASARALHERLLPAVGDGSVSPALAAAVARALDAIGRTVAYAQDIAQTFLDGPTTSRTPEPGAMKGASAVPVPS